MNYIYIILRGIFVEEGFYNHLPFSAIHKRNNQGNLN